MTTQTWRVVCEGGEVREVEVNDRGEGNRLRYAATYRADGGQGYAPGETPRRTLVNLADMAGWDVVELVAPGALTTAEQLAQVTAERDRMTGLHAAVLEACSGIAAAMGCRADDLDDCGEAVRLLVAERDAAVAQRDALAGAVREYLAAQAAATVDEPSAAVMERALAAHTALGAALTGTPVAMVRAEVVRDFLRALDAHESEATRWQREYIRSHTDHAVVIAAARDVALAKRTALDAALAAAGGV